MQRLATVYTERFRLDCVHDDCESNIIVTVEREQGNPQLTVTIQHETDRLTGTLKQESSQNGTGRFRKQHSA